MVVSTVEKAVAPWRARVAALETDLAALRGDLYDPVRPVLRYCGVWAQGRAYNLGDGVTRDGTLWTCTAAHVGGEGFDFACWKLTVKRGGKDARDR